MTAAQSTSSSTPRTTLAKEPLATLDGIGNSSTLVFSRCCIGSLALMKAGTDQGSFMRSGSSSAEKIWLCFQQTGWNVGGARDFPASGFITDASCKASSLVGRRREEKHGWS